MLDLWIRIGPLWWNGFKKELDFWAWLDYDFKKACECEFLDWIWVKLNFNVGWSLEEFGLSLNGSNPVQTQTSLKLLKEISMDQ